jgi:hypothetical protein
MPPHSKNVSAASRVGAGTGIYCLKVTVSFSNVTGAVDTGNSTGTFGAVSFVLSGQDPNNYLGTFCPAGDNVLIGTFDEAGTNADLATWSAFN